jgi:hypothetical protein
MCFGADRKGRVGGAVSRTLHWPPACAGSHRSSKNALTAAAKKRSHELSAAPGSASWRPVHISLCGSRQCQRTWAACVSLERKGPTHPPLLVPARLGRRCGARGLSLPPTRPAAWLGFLGGGWVGQSLECSIGRQCALAPTEKGGWAGQSVERSIGRQRALAATGVPKTRSQLRPTNDLMSYRPPLAAHLGGQCIFLCVARASASAPGPPVYHSSGKAPPTRPSWCQRTLAVGAAPEACLSHPPALRLGSAFWGAGGWGSLSNAVLAASVRWQRDMGGWVG